MTQEANKNRLLAKRYRLMELVGTGAMGHVYRAEDTLLGGVAVAVKFLSQTLLNEKMRERFEREAKISALLGEKSIHIVRVRDYGVDEDEIPFYVMEYLQGESLSDMIKYHPLSLSRFLSLTRQICLGIETAHVGIIFKGTPSPIIHRDIKPSNIFIVNDPTLGELVKVLDFGIAKLLQSADAQTHSFMGTLAYCSPEQMEGKELDSRSDIYSFGVIMYEMLANDMPIMPETSSFGGWYKAHHELKPKPFERSLGLPLEMERLILKCMAKSPKDRPQRVGEILHTLEGVEQSLKNKPVARETQPTYPQDPGATYVPSIDEICLQSSWPRDKPSQKIVFPRIIATAEGEHPTLWVMLDHQDILNRMASTRYNQFLFIKNPHPMLLWITVLYNREYGPRWLPCYLDLGTEAGRKVAQVLGNLGIYQILFFAISNPEECKHVMSSTLASNQCKILKDWASESKNFKSAGLAERSRKRLREELEKLKPKILAKLEDAYSDDQTYVSS